MKVCGDAPSLALLGTATSWRPAPFGLVSRGVTGGNPRGSTAPQGFRNTKMQNGAAIAAPFIAQNPYEMGFFYSFNV
jgi:hypothetical protein